MISTYQLLCILVLSRISAEIIYPAVGEYTVTSLAAVCAAEAVNFLLAVPLLIYTLHGRSFYGAIANKSRVCGWIAGGGAALLLALAAARGALYTAEFTQRTVLVGMSGGVIAILIAAFVIYSASQGAEALARSGVLILAGAVLLTAVVMLAATPHMRTLNPAAAQFNTDFLTQACKRLLHSGEYIAFAALLPYVNSKEKGLTPFGSLLLFGGISLAGVLLINLFCMAVLGEFYGIAEFPLVAASQLSDIALFKRLDGFTGAMWAAASALRSGIMLFSAYAIIHALIKRKR